MYKINCSPLRVITIVVALSFLAFACRMRDAGEEIARQKRDLLTPRPFSFKTVTLDSRGVTVAEDRLEARAYREDLGNSVELEMVEIPAGSFTMGSSLEEIDAAEKNAGFGPRDFENEMPQHQVSVPQFFMGKFEVTQGQWRAVANLPRVNTDLNPEPSTGGSDRADNKPVEKVSWDDAVEFCARLSKATGRAYRLPSEAEWEYSCRAGTLSPFSFGDTVTWDIANYSGGFPYARAGIAGGFRFTVAVGSLGFANRFGLFDMHGNVWEWCADYWHKNYRGAPTDGSAWLEGGDPKLRVARGGSEAEPAYAMRSAGRGRGVPDSRASNIGFRVVAIIKNQ